MELIEVSGYTEEEKLNIAKRHLLPKQMKNHGIKKTMLRVTDDAIREIITCYTRESGVRNLERCFAEICRKAAMTILEQENPKRITVTGSNLETYLGIRRYLPDRLPGSDQVGLVTGLAWTSVGGEMLEIEAAVLDGTGKLELTGSLGSVMQESARAAVSYIRSKSHELSISDSFYKDKDIHIHVPEGATPKDGPSAGITMVTSIVSTYTRREVKERIAMTGEMTLRGKVLPIGGVKEKILAAKRAGITDLVLCQDNRKDVEDIAPKYLKGLSFHYVKDIQEVIDFALL